MVKITIDQAMLSKLQDLSSEIEFQDEAGRTLGYFMSADRHRALLYAWAKVQVPLEELEASRKQTGGRPLSAIRADLEKTECGTP